MAETLFDVTPEGDPNVTFCTCPKCGSPRARFRLRPDTKCHYAESRCPDCTEGAHHWLPKPKGTPPVKSPWKTEASNSGGSSEVPPEGNYPAVLVGLIDLGTHVDDFKGKKYEVRKVLFCWELPTEHKSDGTPFVIIQDYNFAPKLNPKAALRKMLEAWRGKPYGDGEEIDISVVLGKPCLLNIGHGKSARGSEYAKILGIGPLPRGLQAPRPFTPTYTWAYGEGPLAIPDWVPWLYGESVEDVIGRCKELGGTGAAGAGEHVAARAGTNGTAEDEIPF